MKNFKYQITLLKISFNLAIQMDGVAKWVLKKESVKVQKIW